MGSAFFLLFREGLEAALIIGIILGYLGKTRHRAYGVHVLVGVLAGVIGSILTALLFQRLIGGFQGRAEQIFEGLIMLLAVGVLTLMIFWMRHQSQTIGKEIREKIDMVLAGRQKYGLVVLAFLSVYREGVEVVLFFQAALAAVGETQALVGGLLGLGVAVILAYLIFKASINLDIKIFFRVTGVILILISAGLLAGGVHELQEAGVIPVVIEHLYDINGLINEKGALGSILKGLLGYNGNPSLIEVLVYWSYLLTVGKRFLFEAKVVGNPR